MIFSLRFFGIILFLFFFSQCAGVEVVQNQHDHIQDKLETEGINLPPSDSEVGFGKGFKIENLLPSSKGNFDTVDQITFNTALDKLSFMPLSSVDTASGVIITDWYNIENNNLRIKINVRILDSELSENSIVVQLFKQDYDGNKWNDIGKDQEQAEKIKLSILSEARKLKTASELN